jgi:hypothetical protein
MNSFGILVVITMVIVGLSLLLLGVQTFFSKKKKFPHTHVGGNKALAKRGVYCVQTQDAMARRNPVSMKNDSLEGEEDSSEIEK